jgi:hypothetical protein
MSAIPLADAPSLRSRARVTFAVRAALAAIAVGCAVAFLVVSRHPQTRTIAGLPHDARTIVVLDVSASISTDTYSRIGGTLSAISRGRTPIGLVVFSDAAYEALPPGTSAADLRPLVRYFTLPSQLQPGFAPTFPQNPWTNTFSAGTRISAGLDLAHAIATAQRDRPAVVLVSDLDDDPDDLNRLATVVAAYQRDHIPVRVVGLNPTPQDLTLFRRLFGPNVPVAEAPALDEVAPHTVTAFPIVLVALTVALALALAVREAWSPRLEWNVK